MANALFSNNLWVKLEKYLGIFSVVAAFCLILVMAHRSIFDLDIWLHLKAGEFIVQNKLVPSADIFSFTMQGKPWVDHSWFFQVISYLVHSKWQADGLIVLGCVPIILSFLVLFLMGNAMIRSYLEVAVLITAAALASVTRFNIRPDIFSLFFFAIYLYILRLHINKRLIWFLVPVQALWVNFHGYFFLGPLLVALFITAEFLRRRLKFLPIAWREEFALSQEAYRRLKVLFIFVVLACFLNPRGYQGALYPFFVFKELLSGRVQIFLKYIQELQPTLGLGRVLGSYYIMIVLCFLLMAANYKRLKIVEIILALFFFFFSLSLRNAAFFLFVTYMIIASYFGDYLSKITAYLRSQSLSRQRLFILFKCAASAIFIICLVQAIDRKLGSNYYDFDSQEFKSGLMGIDKRVYPKGGVDFISENNIPAGMFNDFNSGAYLIGNTYPERKVFIDGRTELYGPEFFAEYMKMLKGDISSFERITGKYRLNAMLFSTALASLPDIIGYIYKNPHWKLVFLDESAVVFLKDVPQSQELIKRYRVDFKKYTVPKIDVKSLRVRMVYPAPFIKRAALFNIFKEDELAALECKEALRIMPNCAEAYHLLGKMYLRKGLYQDALDNLHSSLVLLPGNVEALLDLGVCFMELKEDKLAISSFKKAIRIRNNYAPAYYRLGCIYLTLNNDSEAIHLFKKAIRYESEEPRYHYKLGQALYEKAKRLKGGSYLAQARLELAKARELNMGYQDKELDKEIESKLEEISEGK
ncbi:MAG: tetratricopeptide repeat protein [Candidatus Omnitrophota bacterium]